MSKLFKKLNEQTELNLIKESIDLSQDIIFSDILEIARESQINEATYTSYRDYYKTMYRDPDGDRKKDIEFRKSEEEIYQKQGTRERENLRLQYDHENKLYDRAKAASEKAEQAEKEAKKANEQNRYSVKFREILNDFEIEVDAIVKKCKELRDDLPNKIDAAMQNALPDQRNNIEKILNARYNNEISGLDDEVDRLLKLYRGKINRLNDESPDYVRTRGTSELNEIKPNIAKYKKGSK